MKDSKTQRKTLIEEFGKFGGDKGKFLQKHVSLIIKTARKKLGTHFSIFEVMSHASRAWEITKDYHSPYKRTKPTSSFTWWLKRVLDLAYDQGITVPCNHLLPDNGEGDFDHDSLKLDSASHRDFFEHPDYSELSKEEEIFYNGGEGDETHKTGGRSEPGNKLFAYVPKYVVCHQSFKKFLRSQDLCVVIKALSDKNTAQFAVRYKKLLKKRRSMENFAEYLREQLLNEATKAGRTVYIARCVNGSYNSVLVAGRSEEEACSYLAPYGEFVEISPLNVLISTTASA